MSLLNKEIAFFLIDQDEVVINEPLPIREPVKIDDLQITLKRDSEFYGVQYEFSDAEIDLGFGGSMKTETGRDLLETIYEANGVDSMVLLRIKEQKTNTVLYEGNINFKSYKKTYKDGLLWFKVKRVSFEDKLRSRIDLEIDLTGTESIDGETVVAASESDICLLVPNDPIKIDVSIDSWVVPTGTNQNDNQVVLFFNVYDINKADFTWYRYFTNQGERTAVLFLSGTETDLNNLTAPDDYTDYMDLRYYNFKNETGELVEGTFTFEWNGDSKWSNSLASTSTDRQIRWMATILNSGELVKTWELAEYNSTTSQSTPFTQAHAISTSMSMVLQDGDEVYVWMEVRQIQTGGSSLNNIILDITDSSITFVANRLVTPIQTKGFTIENAVNKIIKDITGVDSAHIGTFLSTGMAKQNHLIFGQSIIDGTTTNGANFSLQGILKMMRSLFWGGYSIEDERVRIDHAANFFLNKEIDVIEDVYDFEIKAASDKIYNEIEFKFKGSKRDEEGTKLDIHTNTQIANEVKTIKRKYSIDIDMNIDSPSFVKIARDANKALESNEPEDNDNQFLLSTRSYSSIGSVTITGANLTDDFINIQGYFPQLACVSSFTISGSTYHDDTYDILQVDFVQDSDAENILTRVYVNPATAPVLSVNADTGTITFTAIIAPEANQYSTTNHFTSLTSGFDTFPNIRHNIKSILYNHSPLHSMSIHHKSGTKVRIIKQEKKPTLSFTYNTNEDYSTIGATSVDYSIDETQANIEANKLFVPEWITFKTRLTFTEFNRIKEALRNESTEDINYGYISVFNPETFSVVKGFPYEIKKNPLTEETEFKLLRKYES